MYGKDICRILGAYLIGLSCTLMIPFLLAAYYEWITPESHPQPHATGAFALTLIICLATSLLLRLISRGSTKHLFRRDALVVVIAIWLLTPLFAGMPFFFSKTLTDPVHAYFEAVSGFTTTGATTMQAKRFDPITGNEIPYIKIIPGNHITEYTYFGTISPVRDPISDAILYEGMDAVSRAILFWRSFTQWLGGMGIVILFVAVLPVLGVGGKVLFQAEATGPVKDGLTPRIKDAALQLWKIYLFISLAEVVILMLTNSELTFYDTLVITFSNMSTGGFTHTNNGIAAWKNATTEWVIIAFMLLASINFSLYFFAFKGKIYKFFNVEFFLYLILISLFTAGVLWQIIGISNVQLNGENLGTLQLETATRSAAFQLISLMTSTGFSTVDYNVWPYGTHVLMLVSMFIGGMAGSTAGGMKVIRQYVLFRFGQYKVESIFRPQAVRNFSLLNGKLDESGASMVLVFFSLLVAITTIATACFIFDNVDPQTALSLTALTINNVGVGFYMTGPTESCACFSHFTLLLSSALMLLGRLEFFALLTVLVPAFWKKN